MAATFKTVFDHHTNVTVDHKLIKNIVQFLQTFINKNDESVNFFGSALVGVYRPVWTDSSDSVHWLEDICGVKDIDALQNDIYNLKEVDKSWVTATSPTNISFLYLSHLIYTSNLNKKDIHDGVVYCIMLANIKHTTSGMKRRFPFGASEAVALAHFESLDYRSDLKRYGNWYSLFESRGEQALDRDFIRLKQLQTFETTDDIVRWANDLQRRILKLLNGLTESFHETHAADTRITSIGRMQEYEGELEVRPHRSIQSELIQAMLLNYASENSLIRNKIVADTINVVPTCNQRMLVNTLKYLSANYKALNFIELLTTDLVTYMYDQATDSNISIKNVPALVDKYRSMMRSSQLTNPALLRIKDNLGTIINKSNPSLRQSKMGGIRVGLFIYLILRIFYIASERK